MRRLVGWLLAGWLICAMGQIARADEVSDAAFYDAFELLRAQQWDEAITKFEEGLERDPGNATARFYLGEAYYGAKQPDAARSNWQQALEADPNAEWASNASERLASPTDEVVEQALGLTRDQRRSVQHGLNTLGHNAGALDGVFGPGTRRAIAAYQGSVGKAQTGYIDNVSLSALLEAATKSPRPPVQEAGRQPSGRESASTEEIKSFISLISNQTCKQRSTDTDFRVESNTKVTFEEENVRVITVNRYFDTIYDPERISSVASLSSFYSKPEIAISTSPTLVPKIYYITLKCHSGYCVKRKDENMETGKVIQQGVIDIMELVICDENTASRLARAFADLIQFSGGKKPLY